MPARQATLAFVVVCVMLDMVAFGVVIPVLPSLILELNAGDKADTAWWQWLFQTAFAAIQFFTAPVLGALSDRFGRRPVILLSALGLSLDYAIIALAPSLAWLLVGRIIAALCAASISVPSAYIADITAPEERARAFGMLGASFGVGFILGPLIGGAASTVSLRLPFWIAGGLTLASFCWGLFVLPESLPRERRIAFDWRKANPIGAALLLAKYPAAWALFGVAILSYLAHDSLPHVFNLYAITRFGWGQLGITAALLAVGVMSVVVQAGAIGPIVRKLGERRALFFGLAMGTTAFTLYAIAWAEWVVFLAIAIGAFWGVWSAAAQSILSQTFAPGEQGQLQGALAGVRAACTLLTPSLFNGAYVLGLAAGGARFAGAPMLLSALLLLGAIPFALAAARQLQRPQAASA